MYSIPPSSSFPVSILGFPLFYPKPTTSECPSTLLPSPHMQDSRKVVTAQCSQDVPMTFHLPNI